MLPRGIVLGFIFNPAKTVIDNITVKITSAYRYSYALPTDSVCVCSVLSSVKLLPGNFQVFAMSRPTVCRCAYFIDAMVQGHQQRKHLQTSAHYDLCFARCWDVCLSVCPVSVRVFCVLFWVNSYIVQIYFINQRIYSIIIPNPWLGCNNTDTDIYFQCYTNPDTDCFTLQWDTQEVITAAAGPTERKNRERELIHHSLHLAGSSNYTLDNMMPML